MRNNLIGIILRKGIKSGLVMGMALFIGGAILARIFYGPQMAPEGKFSADRMNAMYFILTKLMIGVFFGIVFAALHEIAPLARKIATPLRGLGFGFIIWLVIALWSFSHPLIYGPGITMDRLFWQAYSLVGFLFWGLAFGFFSRRSR